MDTTVRHVLGQDAYLVLPVRTQKDPHAQQFPELKLGAQVSMAVDTCPRQKVYADSEVQEWRGPPRSGRRLKTQGGNEADIPQAGIAIDVIEPVPIAEACDRVQLHIQAAADRPGHPIA